MKKEIITLGLQNDNSLFISRKGRNFCKFERETGRRRHTGDCYSHPYLFLSCLVPYSYSEPHLALLILGRVWVCVCVGGLSPSEHWPASRWCSLTVVPRLTKTISAVGTRFRFNLRNLLTPTYCLFSSSIHRWIQETPDWLFCKRSIDNTTKMVLALIGRIWYYTKKPNQTKDFALFDMQTV